MKIEIYASISGPNYSPDEFNLQLPASLKGEVRPHKNLLKEGENRTYYWDKSFPVLGGVLDVEKKLYEILLKYKTYLLALPRGEEMTKHFDIVCWYQKQEDVHNFQGFSFDNKLLTLYVNFDLDMNIGLYDHINFNQL